MSNTGMDKYTEALGKVCHGLTEADKGIAADISMIYITGASQPQDERRIGFEILHNEGIKTYILSISGFTEVSMNGLANIRNHESIADIRFEPAQDSIRALITIFKADATDEKMRTVYTPPRKYETECDSRMNGLIINDRNKSHAVRIIEHIMNMEKEMWCPVWSNEVNNKDDTYVLHASPFLSITLSFYEFLVESEDVISDVKIRAFRGKGGSALALSVMCSTVRADNDDDDEPPRHSKPKSALGVNRNHHIKKREKTAASNGILSKVARVFGLG